MLKILRKRGEIAPEEFLLLFTIFCYLMLDLYVKRGIRFSLRDKRLFEITEVEITRVDCIFSGAGKFCLAHELGQPTHDVKIDIRILSFKSDVIFAPPRNTE